MRLNVDFRMLDFFVLKETKKSDLIFFLINYDKKNVSDASSGNVIFSEIKLCFRLPISQIVPNFPKKK